MFVVYDVNVFEYADYGLTRKSGKLKCLYRCAHRTEQVGNIFFNFNLIGKI